MRLRRDAPALILTTAALLFAGMGVYANHLFAEQMSQIEDSQYVQMRTIVDFNLQGGQERALSRAEVLAGIPSIREAFALQDRAKLLADTQEMFKTQRDKYGLDQLQFVTQQNVSFLRVNNPEKYGDDLSSFRPIVVAVNQDHMARKGISLSRSGPALMGVVPMIGMDGQPSGLVEMGVDIGAILDKLKATYGFDSTFFVKEEPLKTIATGVNQEVFDPHNRVGEFLKYHSTNWGLMSSLVESGDLARVNGDPVEYVRESLDAPWGVVMVSLKNAAGDSIGIVASARDFSGTRAAAGRVQVAQGASALLSIIAMAGAVLVAIRGFVLRPVRALSEGMALLAKGDHSRVVDAEGFCEELETIAADYEALRKAAQAREPS